MVLESYTKCCWQSLTLVSDRPTPALYDTEIKMYQFSQKRFNVQITDHYHLAVKELGHLLTTTPLYVQGSVSQMSHIHKCSGNFVHVLLFKLNLLQLKNGM